MGIGADQLIALAVAGVAGLLGWSLTRNVSQTDRTVEEISKRLSDIEDVCGSLGTRVAILENNQSHSKR